MATDLTTSRLHISGLGAPSCTLTAADISRRFSAFGAVESIEGFDKLDALGRPKGFGYLTFHGKKSDLARCLTSLSGSTWKGAKLRIGEAKPDFRERIAKENEAQRLSSGEPPRKKARKYVGVESASMDPIQISDLTSPSASQTHPHWKVTPMGRVVRVMKMRPAKPLPPTLAEEQSPKPGSQNKDRRRRKKKGADTRARRRKIDPTLWDSSLLKGIFLENVVIPDTPAKPATPPSEEQSEDEGGSAGDTSDEEEEEDLAAEQQVSKSPPIVPVSVERQPSPPQKFPPTLKQAEISQPLPHSSAVTESSALQQEADSSLALLRSMFDSNDWEAQGDVDSDIDMDTTSHRIPVGVADAEGFEEVPLVRDDLEDSEDSSSSSDERDDEEDDEERPESHEEILATGSTSQNTSSSHPPLPSSSAQPTTSSDKKETKSLKDLFAPHEEEPGFSLLGHLDLDFEMDEDVPDFSAPIQPATFEPEAPRSPAAQYLPASSVPSQPHPSLPTLDPSFPLFFPRTSTLEILSSPDPQAAFLAHPKSNQKGSTKDALALMIEKGLDWKSVGFYRCETDEQIRKRWEDTKVELTRDWKKRAREAGKSSKRRGNVRT